mmetsp:Transcript_29809/g.45441  ORF Transcript_29809/g.45441 Transcript_29809/m.45441 type:complete len:748 (-) Transcript_29809:928-3171(-)
MVDYRKAKNDDGNPLARFSNRSYQFFLSLMIGVSLTSFFQQIHVVSHQEGAIILHLPWEIEFQIRHRRKEQDFEEPFRDSSKKNELNTKEVLGLNNMAEEKWKADIEKSKKISPQHEVVRDRQSKAAANYQGLLKLKAQQLVSNQNGDAHDKRHIRGKNVAVRRKMLSTGPSHPKQNLAQEYPKLPVVPNIATMGEKFNNAQGKKIVKNSSNQAVTKVKLLTGDTLKKAIFSSEKPRRGKMPPLYLKLCDDCEQSFISEKLSCKRLIRPLVGKNVTKAALRDGQAFVANTNDECKACAPEDCEGNFHYPLRFDEGQPLVLHAKTHDLSSIPKNNRIPKEFLSKTDTYFKFWTQDRPPVFFTYNPSIIPIPQNTDLDIPGATYISTYRVSPWHNCGFKTYNFQTKLWNLMGLAVLDKNLDIIDGFDVVVNINEQTQMLELSNKFEDFRLFHFHDKIWLLDGNLIVPIQITRNQKGKLNTMKDRLPVLFGTGLTVSFLEPVRYLSKISPGKDYNIFPSKNGEMQLETKPRSPHTVSELDFEGDIYGRKDNGLAKSYQTAIDSYVSYETFLRRPYLLGKDQGGACCVKLEKKYYENLTTDQAIQKHDYLLMGISHRRTFRKVKNEDRSVGEEKFVYLSRLYAFAPESSFDVVANSGMFCFGFPGDEEALHLPYANATKSMNKLEIYNNVYPCPTVQLATGMTQNIEKPAHIIVSYGINDCIPRMVELHKQDLAHRLFLPLSQDLYAPKLQ